MAFTIPDVEPLQIVIGDRLQWRKTISGFSAAEWILTYYLRGVLNIPGSDPINIIAAADGTRFLVDVAPAVTALWIPQLAFWQARVSKVGDSKLVRQGRMDILPDFSATANPYDGRSWARRARDNIRLVMEGKSQRDTIRYAMSAAGRSEEKFTWEDIIAALSYFESLVAAEEAQEAISRGESPNKDVLIRFRL